MDMTKIGAFLAQLRKEQNLTQAELGEALGVSNKTVSRWETGSYLPPVEMLQALSERYGVSINELLCGERLEEDAYRERAEETIKAALESSFSYPERLRYFQSKWRKDHLDTVILCALFWAALLAVLRLRGVEVPLIGAVGGILAVLGYVLHYNRMMRYAEAKVFDEDKSAPGKRSE
ncbi:MAG: helix-turn-helix transcriptional regulator [Oscillospiraceae bacterium]|jgi:Predicted transcriptional regulators|nr:helix-turn-helix transcriptional regulator [Oscillospiraceae bacterium]